MITKKFIRNSIIYTIAGSLPMASAIILLPFYVKYLSASVYGAMALYMVFSLLVQTIVTYSFDTSIYSYYHDFKNDKQKLAIFVSSIFVFIIILSLCTSIVLSLIGGWIFEMVFEESKMEFYPYGLLSMVTGIFQAIFKVNSSLLQTQERAPSFLRLNLLSFTMIAIFTIGGLKFFPDDLIGPIGGRMLAVTISGLWVLIMIFRQFGLHFNFSMLKTTFGFNHPSLIYQIMQWANSTFDRVLMAPYLHLVQVGIYDFSAKCLSAIEFVLTGFYNSFFPKVLGITALQTEKRTTVEINRYYNGLTAVTIILVVLCIFGLPLVIEGAVWWLNKPEYLQVIQWIPFIAVTYLLRSMRFYVAMPYAALKYSKPLPFFYVIIVAIKISSMIILLPLYGIWGVIIATWVGYIIEVAILYFGVKSKFTMEFNVFKLIVAPVMMAIIIIILEPWFGFDHSLLLHSGYIIFGLALLLWAYRNELKVFQLSKIIK